MKLFYCFLFAVSLFAQTVTVAAQSGTSTQATQLNLVQKSTTTFGLSSGTASQAGAAALNLSAATTRQQVQPIALAFTVNWAAADASGVTVTAGAALAGTGKSLTCTPGTASTACVISGGSATIPDGVAVVVNSTVNKSTAFSLTGVSATNKFGVPLLTAIATGGTVTMPTLLASVTCVSQQIESGEDVACSALLNQPAPAGGTLVALTSSAPASIAIVGGSGVVVSSITVPQGSLSGSFVARGL